MKTPAELYKESLTDWPEPMPGTCLTPDDWREFAGLFVADDPNTAVGLQLASCIEDQGLTASHFKDGAEFLYVFAFNSIMDTKDLERIIKYHKIHGRGVVDIINKDDNVMVQAEALLNQGDTQ